MKSNKQPMSARGKIAMVIVGVVGVLYWIVGKIEVSLTRTPKVPKKNIDDSVLKRK